MNTETNMKGRSRKKRTTGIITAVLAILILVSGTFAWYYVTNAINEFGGKRDDFVGNSAVLHDDFEEKGTEKDGKLIHNKDVYVENTGNNSIFVRIRLDEYMEIAGKSLIDGADKYKESTWKTHIPHTEDPFDEKNPTNPADPDDATTDPFHTYWEWALGGGTEYEPNSKGTKGVVSRYDKNGNDTLQNAAIKKETLRKVPGDATSGLTEVITMAEYNSFSAAEKNTYYGWVYDTDGYAYWSQKLTPNEATGLLLDQVTLKAMFGEETDYYYAINVILETVDEEDLDAWLTSADTIDGKKTAEATDDGKDLLKGMSDQYTRITEDMNKEIPPASNYDKDKDGFLDEEELEEWLEDLDGIIKGEDGNYYRPRPDLGPGKGDIYEEVDKNGKPVDPERIIDSGDDNKPGTPDDEEWTKITDEMNEKEPPARDYDEGNKGYLTPDEKDKWEDAVKEEEKRKASTPISLTATTNGTIFKEGAVLKAADIEVEVTYEDGTTKQLKEEDGYDWTPKEALRAGDNKIKVTYEETPASNGTKGTGIESVQVVCDMTVVAEAKVLESIVIINQPDKTTYDEGESFSPDGMVVKAKYDNKTEQVVTTYDYNPKGALTTDDTTITVEYTEGGVTKKETVTIKVESSQDELQKEIEKTPVNEEITDSTGTVWIILSKDESAGTVEMLAKNQVASGTWHDSISISKDWSESRIRNWLNYEYKYSQLASEIRDNLVTQTKYTNKFGSALTITEDVTQDDVYLLSYGEYENYEKSYTAGNLYSCTATNSKWWLRSPYDDAFFCAWTVNTLSGTVTYDSATQVHGIRPALTVTYK